MRIAVFMTFVIFLSSCSLGVDFAGFFTGYSTPDERFNEKDDLPFHSEPAPLKGIAGSGTGYSFSFPVISDIHVQDGSTEHLQHFIDNYLSADDLFILDCGDSTQSGYENQLITYKAIMNSSGKPWFAVIGNHDLYFDGWQFYRTVIGRTVYSLEVGESGTDGATLIIALDSANGTLGAEQLEWLESFLPARKDLWDHIIVFTHSQFFSTGLSTVVQFTDTEEIYRLMSLFSSNGVDLVLMGHNHIWDDRLIGGVRYVTLDPLSPGGEDSFARITVQKSSLSLERIMINGN